MATLRITAKRQKQLASSLTFMAEGLRHVDQTAKTMNLTEYDVLAAIATTLEFMAVEMSTPERPRTLVAVYPEEVE